MEKKNVDNTEPITPDLKHDTMEYSAATEGDDQLDVVDEDEDITPDELDAIESQDVKQDGYALDNAETDSKTDEDNFLSEPEEDEFDEDKNDDVDI